MGGYITQGNGPALLTSCIVCLVLTWTFFCVRIYTRAVLTKVWKIEDWLFVATQVSPCTVDTEVFCSQYQVSFTIYAFISLESTLHGPFDFHIIPALYPLLLFLLLQNYCIKKLTLDV